MTLPLEAFAPPFEADRYEKVEELRLHPFFTNLNKSVYVPLIFAPELVGALCSLTSRAAQDLRYLFYHRYVKAFVEPIREKNDTDISFAVKVAYGKELRDFIYFLQSHPIETLYSHPAARSFYLRWLAQYGDDSIAQMAGCHLVYTGLSQLAIKHLEDQRVGLAPIEKSTRYVDYSRKVNGHYLYYVDPTLKEMGLEDDYREATDRLFETYGVLRQPLIAWLTERFPEEKADVIEKKAFDTLRGLLPTSTLSQVAFFGNGQAFEHMINRSKAHPLGEIRWAATRGDEELNRIIPAFLRRLRDDEKKEMIVEYQSYLVGKKDRMAPYAYQYLRDSDHTLISSMPHPEVRLVEYDPIGEEKIITGMLYEAVGNHRSWSEILNRVLRMTKEQKKEIVDEYLKGRGEDLKDRWKKAGRALENTFVRFDIVMNIGAWRDLHRHRMHTQQRQDFSPYHGYDIPQEVIDAGLENAFRAALDPLEDLYEKIARHDPYVAQYAVGMAHRMRFMQWQNMRQVDWEVALRTIPEGHPDYRSIEQEKFRLLQQIYPIISQYIKVNMGQYDFARRGQAEKIALKEKKLQEGS